MLTVARRCWLAVLSLLAVVASTIVIGAQPVSATIVDAPRGGNPLFYWLPPTVPTTPQFGGSFASTVLGELVIEICELDGSESCVPGAPLDVITATSGPLLGRIYLLSRAEAYSAI